MTRVNSNNQRIFALDLTVATNLGHAHRPEMCNITHWPFCNSSNSPGKFNSSSGDAVRRCEAPASRQSSSSAEHSADLCRQVLLHHHHLSYPCQLQWNQELCVFLYKHHLTGVCWFALWEPSSRQFHRDRALPHSVSYTPNCINLLNM